jgi:tetratricopeptide (TPR) repeat protein
LLRVAGQPVLQSEVSLAFRHSCRPEWAVKGLLHGELKRTRSAEYDFSEPLLNTLGYDLINKKKLKEAIEILKLNAEMFPRSANVYDSLGEAYMLNGDKDLAMRNYQRSLELNPKNTNAIDLLKKLREN